MEEQEEEEKTGQETGGSLRGWAFASVTQGKAGTRPADSRDTHSGTSSQRLCASFVNENASVFRESEAQTILDLCIPIHVTKTCLHDYMDFIATSWKLNLVNSQI